jgi:hypothetical protein
VLSIDYCREKLGEMSKKLNDNQVLELRDLLGVLAKMYVNDYKSMISSFPGHINIFMDFGTDFLGTEEIIIKSGANVIVKDTNANQLRRLRYGKY